jgi:hypothetical protein
MPMHLAPTLVAFVPLSVPRQLEGRLTLANELVKTNLFARAKAA